MAARVSRPKPARPPVRYTAFLRGVMPTNAKMPDLVRAFASAGFEDVATVLASGNVVFSAARAPEAELARMAEEAMRERLGRSFATIVRAVEELDALIATDPYAPFGVAPGAKRIVTFLREKPKAKPRLPVEQDGARILRLDDRTAFTAYLPSAKGPVFMVLLEKTFGRDITTRTWDTLRKVSAAAARI
jgi:uncharacterized protein (DUF1697 family)